MYAVCSLQRVNWVILRGSKDKPIAAIARQETDHKE